MVRQQDAHRHVGTVTGADTPDGLVIQAGAQCGFVEALFAITLLANLKYISTNEHITQQNTLYMLTA
jgi:hypothetical protein